MLTLLTAMYLVVRSASTQVSSNQPVLDHRSDRTSLNTPSELRIVELKHHLDQVEKCVCRVCVINLRLMTSIDVKVETAPVNARCENGGWKRKMGEEKCDPDPSSVFHPWFGECCFHGSLKTDSVPQYNRVEPTIPHPVNVFKIKSQSIQLKPEKEKMLFVLFIATYCLL